MTTLVPRDTLFRDLFDFRRDFDDIFNRILVGKPILREQLPATTFGFLPPVEAYLEKDNKKFVCRVHLPGIEPGEVEMQAKGNVVTIKGERKIATTSKEVNPIHEEVVYGAFERTLELPEGVPPEKLTAEYHNGVLEITAPVAEAALPRKIEIKTAPLSKRAAA
jgi:HSP20 family protein